MSTPNIEELRKLAEATAPEIREWFVLDAKGWCIAGEGYDAQEYIAAANPAKVLELLDKMQSQAERIKELERESETHAKAYGLAIVERDNLRHELKVAQEGWRCECSTDDACRFARERDALRAQLAESVSNHEACKSANSMLLETIAETLVQTGPLEWSKPK